MRADIKFYFKLPSWFKIKTPLCSYNPDWALVKENNKTLYFVAETKSKGQGLRLSEGRKIDCAKAHFKVFEDIEFKQVSEVKYLD